jgi:hypothetical protein
MPVPHSGVKLSLRRTKLAAYRISISYPWVSRNGLPLIALILPLIASLRRVCLSISQLLVPLKFPLWYYVFSSQRFCRRAVLATGFLHPTTLAMCLPIHCTSKFRLADIRLCGGPRCPLSKSFLTDLGEYLLAYQPVSYLVEGLPGKQYSASSVGKFVQHAAIKAGVKEHVTPHILRRGFATHLL